MNYPSKSNSPICSYILQLIFHPQSAMTCPIHVLTVLNWEQSLFDRGNCTYMYAIYAVCHIRHVQTCTFIYICPSSVQVSTYFSLIFTPLEGLNKVGQVVLKKSPNFQLTPSSSFLNCHSPTLCNLDFSSTLSWGFLLNFNRVHGKWKCKWSNYFMIWKYWRTREQNLSILCVYTYTCFRFYA